MSYNRRKITKEKKYCNGLHWYYLVVGYVLVAAYSHSTPYKVVDAVPFPSHAPFFSVRRKRDTGLCQYGASYRRYTLFVVYCCSSPFPHPTVVGEGANYMLS